MDRCACCRRQVELRRCSRCRAVKYCSKICQISDWEVHKVICRKDPLPRLNLPIRLPGGTVQISRPPVADSAQRDDSVKSSDGAPVPTQTPRPQAQPVSLHLSRIDMSLRDGRWLQYFSDERGLSELDLSRYIGNDDGTHTHLRPQSKFLCETDGFLVLGCSRPPSRSTGKLVWGSTDFHLTTKRAQLTNGHVLVARLYRTDGSTLTKSWINLDKYIHCDDEVLEYDPERGEYGERLWPWIMQDYHISDPPPGEVGLFHRICMWTLMEDTLAVHQNRCAVMIILPWRIRNLGDVV